MWKTSDQQRRDTKRRLVEGSAVSEDSRRLVQPTVTQLLANPVHRRQCVRLLVGALATMTGWWAVSTWIPAFAAQSLKGTVEDLSGSVTLVVLAYNIAGVAGYLLMGWLADLLGRKPVIALFFAASVIVTPLFFLIAHSLPVMVALAALNGLFTLGQMTWLALYPSELFPTNIRATGMSIVFNLARFPVAAGAMLTPVLIGGFGSIATAAIVIGCCGYGLGLLATRFLGPETKGQPLPQASALHRPNSHDRLAGEAGPTIGIS